MPGGINPGQYPYISTPTHPTIQAALDQALKAFTQSNMSSKSTPATSTANSTSKQAPAASNSRQPLAPLSSNVAAVPSLLNENGKRPANAISDIIKDAMARLQSEESVDDSNEDSDSDSDGGIPITHNCDQIRRLITRLIDSGEMTIKGFTDKLNVSTTGYYRFMKQNGRDKGSFSEVYGAAMKFFQKREKKGIKIGTNKNKKAKTNTTASKSQTKSTSKNSTSVSSDPAPVTLDGELTNSVPIYDTCSTIRRKISAHLKQSDVTQAGFLRELSALYHPARKLQSNQLQRFRQMNGPDDGNTNAVYYAAYVYFEKERIRSGGNKTKEREEMEKIYGRV